MVEWNEFWRILSLVFLIITVPVAITIVLEKRSPHKTVAWILVLVLLPFAGILFYLFFGQEFRKQKLFSRKGIKSLSEFRKLSSKQLREIEQTTQVPNKNFLGKENIIRLLLNNSNALLTTGNQVEVLCKGEDFFKQILETIKSARHHIHMEYYIFSDDKIGNTIANLLIEKSKEGVEVRIIIDDVGSWGLSNKFISRLRKNGIEIYPFMEVRFPRLTSRANFRNHRKILVIDGKTGFIGGSNIADRYLEGIPNLGHWQDTNIKITGDAVASLQVVFTADWYFVINENLSGSSYFSPFTEKPGIPIQITTSGPDSDWENICQAYLIAITNARKSVYLVTPYFMPPQTLLMALKTAALSNVDVQVVLPEKSDVITPKWSSFSYVEELLEAGVTIHFFQNGFIHSKYIIIDNKFLTIGTTNFDFRSFETNFEVNAFIYDEQTTLKFTTQFHSDVKNSRKIDLIEWKKRPWHQKFREAIARIFAPMM